MDPSELPIPTPKGFDTVIAARNEEWVDFLPEGLVVVILGERSAVIEESTLDPDRLMRAAIVMRLLIKESQRLGGIRESVRCAWFTVTTDPEVVQRIGSAHDCATCRAGTDQALAQLREHPQEPLIVGVLAF